MPLTLGGLLVSNLTGGRTTLYILQAAKEATSLSLNPVRIKKMYVLAALLVSYGSIAQLQISLGVAATSIGATACPIHGFAKTVIVFLTCLLVAKVT